MTDQATISAASSQVDTDSYRWMGRNQAEFWASQNAAAKANGTDNVSLSFKDALDLVNPLQHIPVIGSIYRAVTGDSDIKPAVKTMGDAIYGGPLGMTSSAVDNIVKQASGNKVSFDIASWLGLGNDAATTQTAANTVAPPAQIATNTAAAPVAAPVTSAPTSTAAAATPAENATPPDDADMKSSDIAWNDPVKSNPFAKFAMDTPAAAKAANTADLANAKSTEPNSGLFNKLQKGPAPEGQTMFAAQTKFPNMAANRFAGTSANPSAGLLKGAANSTIGTADTQAVQASNAAILNSNPLVAPKDTPNAPQSDFAQKMMAAMDRYEAMQKSTSTPAPTVSEGL